MRSILAAGAILATLSITAVAAQAAPRSGMVLDGFITQSYSSKDAYQGQRVTLNNVTSDDGSGAVNNGTLYGTVASVQRASQGRPGRIELRFTRLVVHGATYDVSSTVLKMQANTKNNALKEAGGALAGMLVGNAIGKTLFGGSAGGFIGATGGFLLAKNNRQDISIAAGTAVQVQLNSVTRRQSH